MLGRNHDMPFLGREMGAEPDYSEEMAREIDDEIRRVIEEAHETALPVLREHMELLHQLSGILIERETIDKDQFERLLAGEAEDEVFAEETPPPVAEKPAAEKRKRHAAAEAVPAPGRDDAAAARALPVVAAKPRDPFRSARLAASTAFITRPLGGRFDLPRLVRTLLVPGTCLAPAGTERHSRRVA